MVPTQHTNTVGGTSRNETAVSSSPRDDPASAARKGALAILPVFFGIAPFAAVIGVTIASSEVDRLAGWAASLLLCAGTAQLTAVQLIDQKASPFAVIGAVVLINSRFALYSAGLARWFAHEPLHRRLLLAFPLVDQLFALCSARFDQETLDAKDRLAFYGAAAGVLVTGWVAIQGLAVLFADSIPSLRSLSLAAPLALAGVLGGARHDRGTVTAALCGAAASVAASAVPHHLGLLIGIVAGIGAGSVIGRIST